MTKVIVAIIAIINHQNKLSTIINFSLVSKCFKITKVLIFFRESNKKTKCH